jgi:16S rRNA (guanine966-N2)-methyltransferase
MPLGKKRKPSKRRSSSASHDPRGITLRIIGGRLRGSKLLYGGDLRTRPMKDRVREAAFNLLGPAIKDKYAIDLFAGTGALGLEAISRGARGATFIEQHYPTARVIEQNIAALDLADRCEVVVANTFIWARRDPTLPTEPWVAFFSPPFEFYVERLEEMLELVTTMLGLAPAGSMLLVEADTRFDFGLLPEADRWDVRAYAPAVLGLLRTE